MKNLLILTGLLCLFLSVSCEKEIVIPDENYSCTMTYEVNSEAHPKAAELQSVLNRAFTFTPGWQAYVVDNNGQEWAGSKGFADIPNQIEMQNCHQLMIASISKTVTATLILRLQDEGILHVDDPISDWLEEEIISEIANAETAKISHLLNHTAGMPDYLNIRQALDAINEPGLLLTQREKLEYAYGKPAEHALGERYSYSNTHYVLLGLIVENAKGKKLWDVVEEEITLPLGLTRFEMGTESKPVPDGVARPYLAYDNNKFFDIGQNAVSDAATGDGGIISNMQDLTTFFQALFGGQIISEGALQQMTETVTLTGEDEADFEWEDEGYGYGLSVFNTPQGKAYGHTGFTAAYASVFFYYPDTGASVGAITNGASVDLPDGEYERLRDDLLRLARE